MPSRKEKPVDSQADGTRCEVIEAVRPDGKTIQVTRNLDSGEQTVVEVS